MQKKRVREGQKVALGGLPGIRRSQRTTRMSWGEGTEVIGKGEDREFLNSAPFSPVLALGTSSLYLPGK